MKTPLILEMAQAHAAREVVVDHEDRLATARRAFEAGEPIDEITAARLMQANAAALIALPRAFRAPFEAT